jgi:glycerophosphoryl diester phosphodiesterase
MAHGKVFARQPNGGGPDIQGWHAFHIENQKLVEVLELAARAGVGVYPETKHPAYFRALGLPLEPPLVEALERIGWAQRQLFPPRAAQLAEQLQPQRPGVARAGADRLDPRCPHA